MSEEPVKNLVLVHGGFVDGSGWQGVYDLLTAEGYSAKVVQNPTVSLAGDVSAHQDGIGGWRSHLRHYAQAPDSIRSPRADRFTPAAPPRDRTPSPQTGSVQARTDHA